MLFFSYSPLIFVTLISIISFIFYWRLSQRRLLLFYWYKNRFFEKRCISTYFLFSIFSNVLYIINELVIMKKSIVVYVHRWKNYFFSIVQISLNVGMLVYRFKDYISAFKGIDYLSRITATLSSVSSISYTLIFAITNKIFTHS